jgi:hypothetical protein
VKIGTEQFCYSADTLAATIAVYVLRAQGRGELTAVLFILTRISGQPMSLGASWPGGKGENIVMSQGTRCISTSRLRLTFKARHAAGRQRKTGRVPAQRGTLSVTIRIQGLPMAHTHIKEQAEELFDIRESHRGPKETKTQGVGRGRKDTPAPGFTYRSGRSSGCSGQARMLRTRLVKETTMD